MAAYWIGAHEIVDTTIFADHSRQAVPLIEGFGGRYLTNTGSSNSEKGGVAYQAGGDRGISYRASLDAWYHSPEYYPLLALGQWRATRAYS